MAVDDDVIVIDDSSEDAGAGAAGAGDDEIEEVAPQKMQVDNAELDSDEDIAIVGQTGMVRRPPGA